MGDETLETLKTKMLPFSCLCPFCNWKTFETTGLAQAAECEDCHQFGRLHKFHKKYNEMTKDEKDNCKVLHPLAWMVEWPDWYTIVNGKTIFKEDKTNG